MLPIDAFSVFTGIVSLASFIVQIADWLPRYREKRIKIAVFSFGLFIGSLIATLLNSHIELGRPLSYLDFLWLLLSVVLAIALTQVLFPGPRGVPMGSAFVLVFGSMMFLSLTGFMSRAPEDRIAESERGQLQIDELATLAAMNRERLNFDRALNWLGTAQSKLAPDDERARAIEEEIKATQAAQIQALRAK